jgi:hypothetical protein
MKLLTFPKPAQTKMIPNITRKNSGDRFSPTRSRRRIMGSFLAAFSIHQLRQS